MSHKKLFARTTNPQFPKTSSANEISNLGMYIMHIVNEASPINMLSISAVQVTKGYIFRKLTKQNIEVDQKSFDHELTALVTLNLLAKKENHKSGNHDNEIYSLTDHGLNVFLQSYQRQKASSQPPKIKGAGSS